jgi:hypothetical protein
MVKNLRFRRKKVKFWQKVLLIWHPILKTEGDPNTHDNAYYQSKSWKFLTKIDENQRKMTKNDEKKGKNDFFSSFFVIWTQKFQKIRDRGSACSRDRVFLYNRSLINIFFLKWSFMHWRLIIKNNSYALKPHGSAAGLFKTNDPR